LSNFQVEEKKTPKEEDKNDIYFPSFSPELEYEFLNESHHCDLPKFEITKSLAFSK